MLNVIEK